MSTWNSITEQQKRQFAGNLVERRRAYEAWQHHQFLDEKRDILLIADRPGPGAPKDDAYHHTPFYAKTYSGGWLNALLVEANIPETRLFWENSADRHGTPRDPLILRARSWTQVFALGNNAYDWIQKHRTLLNDETPIRKVMHPQAHKRWNSKEPYSLIIELTNLHTA